MKPRRDSELNNEQVEGIEGRGHAAATISQKERKQHERHGHVNKVILIGNLGPIQKSGARRTAGRLRTCASPIGIVAG